MDRLVHGASSFLKMNRRLRKLNETYYLFITTNRERAALEIGITGDLDGKIRQLEYDAAMNRPFTCSRLLYWEVFNDLEKAIAREQDMKSWTTKRLTQVIDGANPYWHSLNEEIAQS